MQLDTLKWNIYTRPCVWDKLLINYLQNVEIKVTLFAVKRWISLYFI